MRFFDFEINLARILKIPAASLLCREETGPKAPRKHPDEDIDGAF